MQNLISENIKLIIKNGNCSSVNSNRSANQLAINDFAKIHEKIIKCRLILLLTKKNVCPKPSLLLDLVWVQIMPYTVLYILYMNYMMHLIMVKLNRNFYKFRLRPQ